MAADLLQDLGAEVHLAHPLGNNWGTRRVKNDERDAQDLAAMLRLGRLAEGWIAPPKTRELRELVRYRYRLVMHRVSFKGQIHGVMAKNGILPTRGFMWGPSGRAQLDELQLPAVYSLRLESLRELIAYYDREIARLNRRIHEELAEDAGYTAIREIPGVGRVIGAQLVRWAAVEAISKYRGGTKLRADYERMAGAHHARRSAEE